MKYIVKETGEIGDLYQHGAYVSVLRLSDGGLKPFPKTRIEPYLSREEQIETEFRIQEENDRLMEEIEDKKRFERLTAGMTQDDIYFIARRTIGHPRG
jgi:hypothetical protein